MADSSADRWLRRAQTLAEQARLACTPNPAVGCILVAADGTEIGRGATQPVGQAHAEIMALRDARERGHSTAEATAYVTLEPCSHQGRTGPCCEALIAAGIRRVVAAAQDPNPLVAGRGFARLRAAGVDVAMGSGAEATRELNIGFFKRMRCGMPWVRAKVACSLDGRTALPNGASQWITGAAARTDGHAWRARADVVLTGIGTILADNPLLDVRLVATPRQPVLAIADSTLRLPLGARLWRGSKRGLLVYTSVPNSRREAPLRAAGAEVVGCAAEAAEVDLAALLRDLARREMNEVHVEAGPTLTGALFAAGLVDELLLYQAPLLLGAGAGIATLEPIERLDQAIRLECVEASPVGPDLRLRLRRPELPRP